MCGIVCYVGEREAKPILMEGLKRLEYRGYDSAGIAVQEGRNISFFRSVGKIVELERKIGDGIAHLDSSLLCAAQPHRHNHQQAQQRHPDQDLRPDRYAPVWGGIDL